VQEVLKFDNKGYGSALAGLLTALVFLATLSALALKGLWAKFGKDAT
jgi:hypothetical protein